MWKRWLGIRPSTFVLTIFQWQCKLMRLLMICCILYHVLCWYRKKDQAYITINTAGGVPESISINSILLKSSSLHHNIVYQTMLSITVLNGYKYCSCFVYMSTVQPWVLVWKGRNSSPNLHPPTGYTHIRFAWKAQSAAYFRSWASPLRDAAGFVRRRRPVHSRSLVLFHWVSIFSRSSGGSAERLCETPRFYTGLFLAVASQPIFNQYELIFFRYTQWERRKSHVCEKKRTGRAAQAKVGGPSE